MGDHKGYGLAVFVDMFGGVLSDAPTSPEITFVEDMRPEETGLTVILLDIAHFIDVDRFFECVMMPGWNRFRPPASPIIKHPRLARGFRYTKNG